MAFLPGGSDSQASIVVTGQYGAAHFSDKREFYSNVKLEHKGFRMVPVNLKGEGGFTFMNRGGDGQQVGLFDSQGRLAWRYGLGVDPAPNDMTAGDLDGDGLPEFAVGMNGAGGVRLLDRNGKEKWRQPDVYVWHVEILDIDGDGKNEIVHSNVDGRVRIRDADGKLIREISNKSFVASFNICRWPSDTSRWGLLNNHALEGIQLFDFAGHLVTTFEAPIKGLRVFGTPVQLSTTEKTCFALLICDCIPRHDSWLYLYDADGNIVFEKRFLTSQASLLTIPDERPGIERLLVGEAEGQVWQLRLKPEEPVRED